MKGFEYIFKDSACIFDAGVCTFGASACVSDAGDCIMNNTGVLESTEDMKRRETLEKHSKSIWYSEKEGYWYCCLPDSTKKSGWKNIKRKKKSDIEKLLCDFWIERENKTKDGMTLESLFFEFMEFKKIKVSGGTIRRMMIDWNKYYEPHQEFIQKPFKDITEIDIDIFLNTIVNDTPIKDKAFCNMCGILKQTLEYAVFKKYIEKSPYRVDVNRKKIIPSRKNASEEEIYSTEEKQKFFKEVERRLQNNPLHIVALAVLLSFELGTRRGEILALKHSDIHENEIHISRQVIEDFDVSDVKNPKYIGYKVVEYTKTESGDRWIVLTDKAKKLIARIKEVNKEAFESYEDFLFVQHGYLIEPTRLYNFIKDVCKSINIPVKGTHRIRKTYGSTIYKETKDVSLVKEALGHADERTTYKHYIFNTENRETRQQKILDALQGNTTSSKTSIENVRKRERNIIQFPINKKAENPANAKIFR